MENEERCLKYSEVAKRLSISVQTVYRLVRAGELNAIRLGWRSPRITESELSRFISGKQKEVDGG